MKRTVFFAAIFGSFALATAASAGNDQNSDSVEASPTPMVGIGIQDIQDEERDRPSKHRTFGRLGKIGKLVEKFTNDHNEKKPPFTPIDPGKGDGKTTTPEVPTRPGYVWVGDHWERVKAPKQPLMIVDPIPVRPVAPQGRPDFVWVGDHWERVKAKPSNNVTPTVISQPNVVGPVVRDHRNPGSANVVSGFGQSGVVIRDHRTPAAKITIDNSQAPGGVTVTSTPRPPRKPVSTGSGDITGSGPLDGVLGGLETLGDAAGDVLGAAGNAVGIGYGSITPVGPATPAKPAYKAPAGATVRDHR